MTQTWAAKVPAGFQFSVKLFQQFTHPGMFRKRVFHDLTRQLGTSDIPEEVVTALIETNTADLDAFKRGIEPLADAGKLGPLLAQFPASFHDSPTSRTHITALLRAFSEYPVAVELRHRSWSDRHAETLGLLNPFGAAWVQIDEPKFKDSIQQDYSTEGSFFYLRLHGRNTKQWWHHRDPADRYDYLYSVEELEPMARALRVAHNRGKRAYAYANNHKNAQATINAQQLEHLVGLTHAVAVPSRTL